MSSTWCQCIGDIPIKRLECCVCVDPPSTASARLHIVKDQQLVNDRQRDAPNCILNADAVFGNARGNGYLISRAR